MAHEVLEVTITAAHLQQGRRLDVVRCPLALALHETLGGRWCVTGSRASEIVGRGWGRQWHLSPEAAAWVRDFDAGKAVPGRTLGLTTRERT